MKKNPKIILSQLSKDSIEERKQSWLIGGNYCAFGIENQVANGDSKCSCACDVSDYYNGNDGLNFEAMYMKKLS